MLKYILAILVVVCAAVYANTWDGSFDELSGTEIVYALVLSRHGDRTPVEQEIAAYPNNPVPNSTYWPYGFGALTNRGKNRAYGIGKYLRKRYDKLLSRLYLSDEITIRAPAVERCKMVAMTVAAALYKPDNIQRWSESLDWQPVPYIMKAEDSDDVEYFSNCPRALVLMGESYTSSDVLALNEKYAKYYPLFAKYSGYTTSSAMDILMMKGVIDCQKSLGIKQPEWVDEKWDIMTEIEDETFGIFYGSGKEILQLSVGTILNDFLNATSSITAGEAVSPSKLMYLSGHDANVAPLLAATAYGGSPPPARPKFGATYSLELRRDIMSGEYGIAAVYAPNGGDGPFEVLKISGCGDRTVCPYGIFSELISDYVISDYEKACAV